ncbi:hypothetical protein GQ44DRAFT_811135 [Phaeosphaeriaceae sp. PMI808]|nr:hypothetical protein GQ44DRAFT_811135 [Phaeosphaeriaceae sp. PMI808]
MVNKCYVYLSDVAIGGCTEKNPRGKLLAPTSVEFFSVEGERLGEKKSMVWEIKEITGISARTLQGSPLSEFSVDE